MLLFSIFVVAVGLLETSVAFYSLTGSRDVFNLHPKPQSMWTSSDSTALNRDKSFPSSLQLWKRSEFGGVSSNDSSLDGRYMYPNICACWEKNEGHYIGTYQVAIIQRGKQLIFLSFVKSNFGLFLKLENFQSEKPNNKNKKHRSVRDEYPFLCCGKVTFNFFWMKRDNL